MLNSIIKSPSYLILMPKKLLQINTVSNFGSTGRIAEDLAIIALTVGWSSFIVFGRKKRPSKSNQIHISNNLKVLFHVLQTRLFDNHGLAYGTGTRRLGKLIQAIGPDIIHLHNLHGYYLNYKVLFKVLNKLNIPIIWTIHDCWPFTGHCVHFSFVDCNKWETECKICPQKTTYPASWVIDRSQLNFNTKKEVFSQTRNLTIIAVSDWMSKLLKHSFLANHPILVINNGVDTTLFLPKNVRSLNRFSALKDKFVILGVANKWTPRKGLNDFVKLSRLLSEKDHIILIGIKPSKMQLLPNNITAFPRTENLEELVDYYNIADVYVNPTWEDNFPTTNLEALACGTPVITYKTGGSPEAIDDYTGFVVNQGDIKGLLEAITTVKTKGKSYFSNACRERAINHFSKKDRYNDYLNLYETKLRKEL